MVSGPTGRWSTGSLLIQLVLNPRLHGSPNWLQTKRSRGEEEARRECGREERDVERGGQFENYVQCDFTFILKSDE